MNLVHQAVEFTIFVIPILVLETNYFGFDVRSGGAGRITNLAAITISRFEVWRITFASVFISATSVFVLPRVFIIPEPTLHLSF